MKEIIILLIIVGFICFVFNRICNLNKNYNIKRIFKKYDLIKKK